LIDILTDRHDALVVPKANSVALTRAIDELIDQPSLARRLADNARRTGAQYDISVFVRKMERLYELLHETSRATQRAGVLRADLGFLTTRA
jgi:glycosyltransferase involved in cell wall biosynthesis